MEDAAVRLDTPTHRRTGGCGKARDSEEGGGGVMDKCFKEDVELEDDMEEVRWR